MISACAGDECTYDPQDQEVGRGVVPGVLHAAKPFNKPVKYGLGCGEDDSREADEVGLTDGLLGPHHGQVQEVECGFDQIHECYAHSTQYG